MSRTIKLSHFIRHLITALALASCAASVAKVAEIKPERDGFETKVVEPMAALERQVAAAERAWRKLDRDPVNVEARRDYNFAVARIFGTLCDAKLKPWAAPIKAGTHTLAWQPHPKAVWNPALYDLIPTDQLKIAGTYVDGRGGIQRGAESGRTGFDDGRKK